MGALAARQPDNAPRPEVLRGAGTVPAAGRGGGQPPLAGGGLAGARALSLVFMLGATALLWAAAGRLFGHGAAFFAAALFATLGPVLHLGAFATYDAPALFLVALAAWCVIRAPGRLDGYGGRSARAGQRHGVCDGCVRPVRGRGRAADRAAGLWLPGRAAAGGDGPGRCRRVAGRRRRLPGRVRPHHPGPGARLSDPAGRAGQFLAVGGGCWSSWPAAGSSPARP